MENKMFTVVLHQEEDMFVAECPEVGTVSQGATIDEAVENIKEATELYLEEFPMEIKKKPIVTFFEIIKNASIMENSVDCVIPRENSPDRDFGTENKLFSLN